jgi:hypothetical protein
MSGEKQPRITKKTIINRVAKDSKTPTPALERMVRASEEANTYESRLHEELDIEETLSSIRNAIKRKGFIEGEQVG